jgi:hypothetical protein
LSDKLEISLKANFSLFEENETSKTSSFYKFGKHQQSRYIEINPTIKIFQIIADTIWISEIYLWLLAYIKSFNRKGGKL